MNGPKSSLYQSSRRMIECDRLEEVEELLAQSDERAGATEKITNYGCEWSHGGGGHGYRSVVIARSD